MSNSDSSLEISRCRQGTTVYLRNYTSLDTSNIDDVGEQLTQLADTNGKDAIRLDLRDVRFLTSMALGKFLTLNKRVQSLGGRLTLENMQPMVREIFSMTRLDQLIDVYDGEAAV